MKDKKFVSMVLVPSFALLFLFVVFPLFYGLGISFFDYNPARDSNPFLGLDNYMKMFQDPIFKKAVVNTLVFGISAIDFGASIKKVENDFSDDFIHSMYCANGRNSACMEVGDH